MGSKPTSSLASLISNWKSNKPRKYKSEVIDDVLYVLQHQQDKLKELTSSGFLDKYAWANFDKDVSNNHVIAIVYVLALSEDSQLLLDRLTQDATKFQELFYRVLSLLNEASKDEQLVRFMLLLVNNMKQKMIKKLLAPLFSIFIWNNLNSKETLFTKGDGLESMFLTKLKVYNDSEPSVKENNYLAMRWFYNFAINTMTEDAIPELNLKLIFEIISYLPTRRFTNTILKELDFLASIYGKVSEPIFNLAEYFICYPLDDITGEIRSYDQLRVDVESRLLKLQKITSSEFELSTLIDYPNTEELLTKKELFTTCFDSIDTDQLKALCQRLDINTVSSLNITFDRKYILNILWFRYNSGSNNVINKDEILPDYQAVTKSNNKIDPTMLQTIGYLSTSDFCQRLMVEKKQLFDGSFDLFLHNIINRLKIHKQEKEVKITGSSKFCIQLAQEPIIHETEPELFGNRNQGLTCEVILEFKGVSHTIQAEWDTLKKGSIVFLVGISQKIDMLVPAIVDKVSTTSKNRGRSYIVKVDAKYKTEGFENFNFILRMNQDLSEEIKLISLASHLSRSKEILPLWIVDLFLRFGKPSASFGSNLIEKPLRLKLGSVVKDINQLDHLCNDSLETKSSDNKRRKTNTTTDKLLSLKFPFTIEFEAGSNLITSRNAYTPYYPLKQDKIEYTKNQIASVVYGLLPGLTMIDGPINSGKQTVLTQLISLLLDNFNTERTVIVTRSNKSKESLLSKLSSTDISFATLDSVPNSSLQFELLAEVQQLATDLNIEGTFDNNSKSAIFFYKKYIAPLWSNFLTEMENKGKTIENLTACFPFKSLKFSVDKDSNFQTNMHSAIQAYDLLLERFRKIQMLEKLTVIQNEDEMIKYNIEKVAKVIVLTLDEILGNKLTLNFDNLIIFDASHVSALDFLQACSTQSDSERYKRIVLFGNSKVFDNDSIWSIFSKQQVPLNRLDCQFQHRPEFDELLESVDGIEMQNEHNQVLANPGLLNVCQFINVEGNGEIENLPDNYQNVEEAEFVVCLYMYLRFLDYETKNIAFVTPYKTQQLLIKEVIDTRCSQLDIFGAEVPDVLLLSELDGFKYDYILVSLVNTKKLGPWTEPHNLERVLQICNRGLYIFGQESVYKNSVFSKLIIANGGKLQLVIGEMYSNLDCNRTVNDQVDQFYDMESLEHFGDYIYQMLEKRMKS
ncbi:hypothetical protein CANARDRAFT_26584 [[Candida] arabinofermentans NRRL YB-2248]|uniref:DNA2/NAM7 helicase-like C-terminal domain-containing protein n=1 Tax=[Candida] arabinofermentans NRRL YB-2248 TaxID=983967 RepID=A0A1E4T619_9ASCO|nr:hypothetical protein CANARDRAFT_26584 [[Candida] arabinofermentans NRRL YB-2248]